MASMQVVEISNKVVDFNERIKDKHKISIMENLQKEKQIVVDPLSLKESSIMLPTIITTCSASTINFHPPILKPPNSRFLSLSLPNSANSSLRFASALPKKKSRGYSQEPQCQVATSNLTHKNHNEHDLLDEMLHLRKSKSCDERRTISPSPSHELDQWLNKLSAMDHGTFSKTEAVKGSPKNVENHIETQEDEEGFRCSALCMYLPGFGGRVKQVKMKKEESPKVAAIISRTVSLENFECGSWASAPIHHEIEGESNNSFFDLPMELIKCSSFNEVHSPLGGSFAFEKELKGVLKNGSSRGGSSRKSDSSPRHVRFSASPPSASCPASPASCITPRLRKARDDFNAFLAAAQSA